MSEHTDTISDFCNISSSKRIFAREYQSEGIPFWRGKEIVEKFHGKLEVSTELFIPEGRYEEIKAQSGVPKVGDILLTSVGTIGIPYLVSDTKPFYFKDGNITWLQTKETVCAAYLYYWLISPIGKRELSKCTIGVAQPAYTIVRLKRMSVAFPDLPTQERIAAILSAYDDLIENNRRRIALLEQAARLLYREWFVHFRFPGHETAKIVDGLPEGWKSKTLSDHVELRKEAVKPGQFTNDDVHIGLEHIPRRSFVLSDWEETDDLASHKLRFTAGDIIFGKIRPYFHKVGFALRDGVASSDAFIWRVRDARLWPLVVTATSSDHFVAVASKTVREGSKMPRADWKVLANFNIPVPPLELLDDFNNKINPISEECKKLALQNRQLIKARDLLLPRLMDGRIPVKV